MYRVLAPSEEKLRYILTLPPLTPSFYASQTILYSQALVYSALCVGVLLRYKRDYKAQFSNIEKDKSYWLTLLIGLTLMIWLSKLLATLFNGAHWLSQVGSTLIVLLIYTVGFMQWFRPQLFHTQQLFVTPEKATTTAGSAQKTCETQIVNTTEKRALAPSTQATLADVINDAMIKDKLYLQEDLSLADLSQHTNISIHHLSETLNHYVSKNFYRYINEYRVMHFCELLTTQPDSKITVLAMNSGFANKSTFNAAFKELKGITPSEYRKHALNV